jgi:hypothetical protein
LAASRLQRRFLDAVVETPITASQSSVKMIKFKMRADGAAAALKD